MNNNKIIDFKKAKFKKKHTILLFYSNKTVEIKNSIIRRVFRGY